MRRLAKGFTLIELLVVITIIAVLIGVLLPVVSKVTINAQKTAAKNTELQVVTAIKNFKTEYGVYPMPQDAPANAEVCFGLNAPTAAELFDILQADNQGTEASANTRVNTRGIVYIQLPQAKVQTVNPKTQIGPKNGLGADRNLYDPWGRIYLIGVDGGYTGYVNNPYNKGAGSVPLRLGVIVYSWGPDALTTGDFFGGGAKTDSTSQDDVLSWQ